MIFLGINDYLIPIKKYPMCTYNFVISCKSTTKSPEQPTETCLLCIRIKNWCVDYFFLILVCLFCIEVKHLVCFNTDGYE